MCAVMQLLISFYLNTHLPRTCYMQDHWPGTVGGALKMTKDSLCSQAAYSLVRDRCVHNELQYTTECDTVLNRDSNKDKF